VRVGFSISGVEPVCWDLVTDATLARFNKTIADIVDVQYRQYYPGYPYLENGLARANHPLIGSGSAHVYFPDGSKVTICGIYYQDNNPEGTHYGGQPHWNHERRFMCDGWSKPEIIKDKIECHQIPKSEYIDIHSEVGGVPKDKIRIYWADPGRHE
jgi:hypothetical protein